ncbi:hypothetical protein MBANPS3_007992 [Mucor bainieri]
MKQQLILALPVELVQRIVYYLDRHDLVQCQCVCRSWYRAWIQFNYDTVHIRGKVQCHSFLHDTLHASLMAAPDSPGYHVRKLVIENGHLEPSVLGQLPALCPFVEVLILDGVVLSQAARRESFQYYQQRRHREELDKVRHQFAVWKQMRTLVELNGITVALALLQQQQPAATQLTSLSVQFNNPNDRTNSKSALIQSLHHAPRLQSLGMERIYLTVDELELIHDSCPELVSLRLTDTVLLPMSVAAAASTMGRANSIKTAVDLRQFQFVNGSFCDDVPRWLHYISNKYVHARQLEIGPCSFFDDTSSKQEQEQEQEHTQENTCYPPAGRRLLENNPKTCYEPQLVQLAKQCTKLRTFKMPSFCLPATFFQTLDQQATFLNELTLGDGLTTNNLTLAFKGLLKSQQRHTIKTLTVLAWPLAIEIRGLHTLMSSLGQCTHMTTLCLSLGRHFYQNDHIMSASGATADAKLSCTNNAIMSSSPSTTTTTTTTNASSQQYHHHRCYTLVSLLLENVLIDSGSDVFGGILAVQCPHLVDLYLIATISSPVYHNTRNFNIYLPRHPLRTLVLDRIRVSRKCSVRLGTSRFKITQNHTSPVWYDLVSYECCTTSTSSSTATNRSFFFTNPNHHHHQQQQQQETTTHFLASMTSNNTNKMRARKVKKIQDTDVCYSSLDQSIYVSVVCKSIESLYLTGLYIK